MKKMLLTLLVLFSLCCAAQDDDCLERILAKNAGWKKINSTVRTSAAQHAIQKKFTDEVHAMVAAYQPRGLQAQWYSTHQPVEYKVPLASFTYRVIPMKYLCSGSTLEMEHEGTGGLTIHFNSNYFRWLFQPTTEYESGPGFDVLREGMPKEISPGIWQFKEVWTPLGFTREGLTRLWLYTYPGQLPWSYISRLEFLQKRRSNLLRMMKDEEDKLQSNLSDLERTKKNMENVLKNDPAQYASYIKNHYEPAPQRFRDLHDKSVDALKKAIDRVEQQLQAPEAELNKQAIVAINLQNHLDYNFAEPNEQGALVLVKPNPAYLKKLAPSVPQFITAGITYYPPDRILNLFATDMEKQMNHGFLQSCVGKTVPPAFSGAKSNSKNAGSQPSATGKVSGASVNSSKAAPANAKAATPGKGSGQSAYPSGKALSLSGMLSAPAGVPIQLDYNQDNELSVTVPKASGSLYRQVPFRFTRPIREGEDYQVMFRKIPSNMKGVLYQAKGKAPEGTDQLKLAVDFQYELLTRSSDDKTMSSFYESFAPAVGGYQGEEGRYVVFVSNTRGFAGSDGKFRQVFWRDRNTGITKMISVSATGEQANGNCGEPSVSADGKTVVFESAATNLVAGDNNRYKDIFCWRAATNRIELVSQSLNGAGADADCFDAAVSGNGQYAVFTSAAGNLSATPRGRSVANIFLRDMLKGETTMISVDPQQKTGGNGYKASISFDGSRISFCSASNTLVPNDRNNLWDIFLWQRGQANLKRISLTHDGQERNGGSESASRQVASVISGNGKYVAFASTASNMVPNDNNTFQDVFVVEVETGRVMVASFTNDGQASNGDSPIEQGERVAISYDGTWVAFPSKASNLGAAGSNIIVYNTVTGKNSAASNVKGSYVGRPCISYSGSYIVFGKSDNLDNRFSQSGIFAHFTGHGPCRDCKE